MKGKFLLYLIISLMITSLSIAQVPADQDTIEIPAGVDGALESTINNDIDGSQNRINPNRVYKLFKDQIYVQNAPINVVNPTGTLTIVGEAGGKKPVIIMVPPGAVALQQNAVEGSIKLVNIHYQGMQTDGTQNNENWFMTTSNSLPQSLTIDNCLFEFANIDFFECMGWTSGAKFKITNSYFRNLFYPGQWWGSRVFMCKHPIDTLWVENVTVSGGGLTFLQQEALCKFAYFNHNTFINNHKYWLLNGYYLEAYWANNIFTNQNWVGEDTVNVATGGQDPDALLMGTIQIDTITYRQEVHPQYRVDEFTLTDDVSLDKIKVLVADNIYWTDPLLDTYYNNVGNAYNDIGPYPVSYLTWSGIAGPHIVLNVPGIWMNERTQSLINEYPL